jgi:hypothetical protein
MRKGAYWHIFPTFAEAKNAVWLDPNMLFRVIPPEIIKKKNETELRVELINGSYIQLIGADNPDRLRGAGPLGMVLDEYDTMKNDVWAIVQPIVRANRGWAWFIGTPKGKAKLYDMYNLGQSRDEEWGSWLLKASTSGIIPRKDLENSKKTMSQAHYNQEWECEFLEGEGAVFRHVRAIATATPKKPQLGHKYIMGVDLAKVQDYTVISIYDRSTNEQVYQDRFNKIEYPFQKKRIVAIARFYNNAYAVIDSTGIGDPIFDDLVRSGLKGKPIKINNTVKKEMVEKLSIWIEQEKIKIIPINETLIEFDNFSYELSSTGLVRYNARQGYHDDIVIAHALAVMELQEIKVAVDPEAIPFVVKGKAKHLRKRQAQHGAEYYDY